MQNAYPLMSFSITNRANKVTKVANKVTKVANNITNKVMHYRIHCKIRVFKIL